MAYNVTSLTNSSGLPITVNWSGTGVGKFSIQRATSNSGPWVTVMSRDMVASGGGAFVDAGVLPNSVYYYRTAGALGRGTIRGPVYTRLAAPTGLSVVRTSGVSVIVNASLSAFADMYVLMDGDSVVEYGSAASLPRAVTSDGADRHYYSIRSARSSGGTPDPNLTSASSETIIALSVGVAGPPSLLAPDGVQFSSLAGSAVFSWKHNPRDLSVQTAAKAWYRRVGDPAWTVLFDLASSIQSAVVTLPSAGQYEWKLSTAGVNGQLSNSATALFTVLDVPSVVVTAPSSGTTVATPVAAVAWSSVQAQGWPQTAFLVELCDDEDNVIESRSGSGGATSLTFATRLQDGGNYAVRVHTWHGGVESEAWSYSHFAVAYTKPAVPTLTAIWDDNAGTMNVAVAEGTGGGGVAATVRVMLERSLDQVTWELVADPGGTSFAVADGESRSAGVTWYRATAWSADGAIATRLVEAVASSGAIWLSTGPGFALIARLPFNPDLELEPGRERSTRRHEGRSLPVVYSGDGVSLLVKIAGSMYERDYPGHASADAAFMTQVAQHPGPVHMVRDPQGRRIYGAISTIPMPRERSGRWSYSLTLEQTAR